MHTHTHTHTHTPSHQLWSRSNWHWYLKHEAQLELPPAAGAWRGVARRGVAWRGVAWRGVAWRGVAWRGVAWRGVAWRGVAWRGVAWRGVAWRGAAEGLRVAAMRACVRRRGARGDHTLAAPSVQQPCSHTCTLHRPSPTVCVWLCVWLFGCVCVFVCVCQCPNCAHAGGLHVCWDDAAPTKLHMLTGPGRYSVLQYRWSNAVSGRGTAAVIDGHQVLLTPLR
jgi:hypothetical protein